MRKFTHPIFFPILALNLLLAGCAGQQQRPAAMPTKPEASHTAMAANPAVFENRQVKTLEPIHVQAGRYSVVTAKPSAEQVNPLLVVIDVRLPHEILTVQEAANYLLQRSGYRLSEPDTHSPPAQVLAIPDDSRHTAPSRSTDLAGRLAHARRPGLPPSCRSGQPAGRL